MSAIIHNPTCAPLNWEQRLSIILAKRAWVAVVVCCAVALIATLPLFIYGFPKGSDAVKHYRWSTEFAKSLGDGAWYPRWFSGANHGAGSPIPLYYPPVPFYVAAAFNGVVANMLTAISLSCWLALALSGLTMYAMSRLMLSRAMSLIAAVFYMIIPYHILDLYQGSALSEYWSFAWVPLILYFTYRTSEESGARAVAGLAVSYALLIQTHVVSTFLISLALPLFTLLLTRDGRRLLRIAAGLVLGAGLSAIFLLPVIFERKYVHIERALRHDYKNYFLFEHLAPAFKSIVVPSEENAYSLQVDLAGLGLLLLLAVSVPLIWKKLRASQADDALWRALFAVTALSLLMTLRLTTPLWRIIPGISFVQFPFRWLLICSAGAIVISAAAVWRVRRRAIYATAFVLIMAFNLAVSAIAIARMPQDLEELEEKLTSKEVPEYHPVWWDGKQNRKLLQTPALVDEGDAVVHAVDETGINQSYDISASSASLLRMRPLYFPGWVARVDGKPLEIWPSNEGNIELKIEPGEHHLTLSFEDTWPRLTGRLISAASLLCFLFLPLIMRRVDHY
ncbi:MAG: 6-pyruvoyl-tetrahydropterin synthase-related protein [Blastocatellia bacterium]